MKRISVIIVSWNACKHLRNCLDSVRESGAESVLEVIVVDNASRDGSQDMVRKEFPEITLICSDENLGFARANNLGIRRASGSYLALVNSDVLVHRGCFETLVEYMGANPSVGLVGPKVFGADGSLQRTCGRLPTVWNTFCRAVALDSLLPHWRLFSGREMRHWTQDNLSEVEVLSGCFWMANRDAVALLGGLDERFFFYAEDVDWCKRFRDAGWKVVFFPAATATHFGGGSSANAPMHFSVQMLRANLQYWRKHYQIPGQIFFVLVSILHHTVRAVAFRLIEVFGARADANVLQKRMTSFACLTWLLTGRSASRQSAYVRAGVDNDK